MSKHIYIKTKLPIAIATLAIVLPAIFYGLIWTLLGSDTLMTYKRDMIEWKSRPLRAADRKPAIIIMGGSGNLYSFDTPFLEQESHRPAINFGTQWGVSFLAAEAAADLMVAGDIAVMPLEYALYESTATDHISYVESCYLVSQGRHLMTTTWQRVQAVTGCDVKLAIYGIFIKALRLIGRADPVNDMGLYLNAHGDIMENAAGVQLIKIPYSTPEAINLEYPFQLPRLERLAQKIQGKGGVFVLTFPAYPVQADGRSPIRDEWVEKLHEWGATHNIPIVSTPQENSFQPDCFFDSIYHLHRGCTRKHTQILFSSLKKFLQEDL